MCGLASSPSASGSYSVGEYSKLRDKIIYLLLHLSFLDHQVGVLCWLRCMSVSASLTLLHTVVAAGLGVRLLPTDRILFTFGKWLPTLTCFQSHSCPAPAMVCWDADVDLLGCTLVSALCIYIALCLSSSPLHLSLTAQCCRKLHALKHIPRSMINSC